MKNRIRILKVMIIILTLLLGIYTRPVLANTQWTDGAPIVLRGTIVTPDGVIKHGYVLIENGRIMEVSDKQPDMNGVVELNTEGIIYPGLVDVHNHVPWNVLPRWTPPQVYTYYTQWETDPEYLQKVKFPL